MVYKKILRGEDLTRNETRDLMDGLLTDRYSEIQKGAVLTALSIKGETATEIGEGVRYLRQRAEYSPCGKGAIDIVGTGGDGLNTINISTASSFVAAAAGALVIKHGNRSVSSKSGSSDLLSALGADITKLNKTCDTAYKKSRLTFLYAPHYHPVLKSIGPVRRELGTRSIFNLMGPLANPSSPDYILLGVYSDDLMEKMAVILMDLGIKRGMVVHGVDDGVDEISVSGPTKVIEISCGKIKRYNLNPEELGLRRSEVSQIEGGSPCENAKHITNIFLGRDRGAKRDAVVINSGAALYVSGVADTIIEGVRMAEISIDSGETYKKMKEYIEVSR